MYFLDCLHVGVCSQKRSWKLLKVQRQPGQQFLLCQILPKMLNAHEAFSIIGDHIVYASGSPFKNVDLGNGKIGHVNQGNNIYLFPGIGLGTLFSGSRTISDGMLQAAAERLASYMTDEEVLNGVIYPSTSRIRDITKEVAVAVVKEAIVEDLAEGYCGLDARELQKLNKEELLEFVEDNMWSPVYPTLVYRKH